MSDTHPARHGDPSILEPKFTSLVEQLERCAEKETPGHWCEGCTRLEKCRGWWDDKPSLPIETIGGLRKLEEEFTEGRTKWRKVN